MAEAVTDLPPSVGITDTEKPDINIFEVAKEYQGQVIFLLGIWGEWKDQNPEFLRKGADIVVRSKANRLFHTKTEKGIPIIPAHSNPMEGRPSYLEVWKGGRSYKPIGPLKADRKPLMEEIVRLSNLKAKPK